MIGSRLLNGVLFAFAVFAALIVLFINRNLATLVESMFPGSLWWTHGTLLVIEAVAFFRFWRGVSGGRAHLLLHDDAVESRKRFAKELAYRMRANPHIREAGLVPAGPDDTERIAAGMALLRARADMEIEQHAKRVFLATALSQNGRLDALIVFFSLCRLVWRISGIYNQRPHPREIASLYWAVLSSTFLALSLEELDLTTEISVGFGQAVHAIAPAGLTAGIPFAGRTLQTFTASAIDGTINCYLTLRTGIVARNAYDYVFSTEARPSRAAVYREAGALLLTMSASLMDRLASGITDALTDVMKNAQDKTVQAGKDIVQGIGSVGVSVGRAAADAGAAATEAAANIMDSAATATRSAIATTVDVTTKPFFWMLKRKPKSGA